MDSCKNTILIAVLFIPLLVQSGHAKKFFIDPVQGSIANDGTSDHPWSTLQQVLDSNKIETRMYQTEPVTPTTPLVPKNPGAPVKPGDTLVLRTGYHGRIFSSEYYNQDYITIMAQKGQTPKIASLELRSGCKWIVRGVTVSPSFAPAYVKKTLIDFSSHSWTGPSRDCVAEACTAYSVIDASSWTMQQWDTVSCNAANVPGNKTVIRNCYFKNVNFGISVTGDSCLIENNVVENFAGDGLRGLGDYCIFQYNTVKNCCAVNANHDDGFQSWSVGDSGVGSGVVYGIVLRGNTIINYENPGQPFRGTLQGIGCFDGMFEGWLVVNNVIMTDHWHGITLSGATNCVIINNTVVDLNTADPGPPWISIGDHKNGTMSTRCIVRNNLSTSFNISSQGVTQDHNIKVTNYNDFFINYPAGNLHLKQGCAAIDSGSPDLAPTVDRDRNPRPQGTGIDIGAYEYGIVHISTAIGTTDRGGLFVRYVCGPEAVVLYCNSSQKKDIVIYDMQGRLICSFLSFESTKAVWSTRTMKSGVYCVRVKTGGQSLSARIVLLD